MGEVYLADDLSLKRKVALKFLPEVLEHDEISRKRFLREARSAAALDHPFICSIHEVGTTDSGQNFIVMEYVEGVTLKERLAEGPVPVGEAIRIASEVAEALGLAHEKGIVHRDLKPANVMLTRGGHAKVMDFGLAKKVAPEGTGRHDLTATLTREGSTLGTLAYMSPEQIRGKPVDARSDNFAFGVILYELIMGTHPFTRGTTAETINALLAADPPPFSAELQKKYPLLPFIFGKTVRKDPTERYQSINELRTDLAQMVTSLPTGGEHKLGWTALKIGVPLLLILGGLGLVWWMAPPSELPATNIKLTRFTTDVGLTYDPALSADGRFAAFASDRQSEGLDIYVQQTSGGQAIRLTSHPNDDSQPSFSPDGSRIVFHSRRGGEDGLFVVDALGGTPRKLVSPGISPRFSPVDPLVAYLDPDSREIFVISSQRGDPQSLAPGYRAIWQHRLQGVVWSEDGGHILFTGYSPEEPLHPDWYVVAKEGGDPIPLGGHDFFPEPAVILPAAWYGDMVYSLYGTSLDGVNIFRTPLRREVGWQLGEPQQLTTWTNVMFGLALTRDGRALFAHTPLSLLAWTVPIETGRGVVQRSLLAIEQDFRPKLGLTASEDASRLAFASYASVERFSPEVQIIDRTGAGIVSLPLAGDPFSSEPRLSPDGELLAYRDWKEGRRTTILVTSDGTLVKELCQDCRIFDFASRTKQVFMTVDPARLLVEDLETGSRETLLEFEGSTLLDADVSFDDGWITFLLRGAEGTSLYLAPTSKRPVPASEWIRVFADSKLHWSPRFSPDGNRLFFLSNRDGGGCIWAQDLEPTSKRPAGESFAVHHAHSGRFRLDNPPGWINLSVTRREILFFMVEIKGNLFLAQF